MSLLTQVIKATVNWANLGNEQHSFSQVVFHRFSQVICKQEATVVITLNWGQMNLQHGQLGYVI